MCLIEKVNDIFTDYEMGESDIAETVDRITKLSSVNIKDKMVVDTILLTLCDNIVRLTELEYSFNPTEDIVNQYDEETAASLIKWMLYLTPYFDNAYAALYTSIDNNGNNKKMWVRVIGVVIDMIKEKVTTWDTIRQQI